MTSGEFHTVEVSSVTVVRELRQRHTRSSDHIPNLAKSIRELGLIHPIVITRDHMLVAGECRLEAIRDHLRWTHITAQYLDEVDELTRWGIELEENIRREALDWRDETLAIAQYHELRKERELANGKQWTQAQTADMIGLTQPAIQGHLKVAKRLEFDNDIITAQTFKTALNTTRRKDERDLQDNLYKPFIDTYRTPIRSEDALQWIPSYTGIPFNIIHCDFPYGIESHKHEGQNSALPVEYVDDEVTYWNLFNCLHDNLNRVCAENAHMIFWFSANVYCPTWEKLNAFEGFRWESYPLIWLRGENEGIASDTARRPRRVYEMAFFGWRGDRKIIRTKANAFTAPTERERHPHEKSEAALRHWFEMCVDGNTRLFDPTCGSGSALRAALSLGASSVLGLELNEEYAKDARIALGTSSGDLRYA